MTSLALHASGLALRALAQSLLAVTGPSFAPDVILRVCVVGSGVLELVAVSLAVWLLAQTVRRGPPLQARKGLRPVLPFFLTSFGALWLALVVNLIGLLSMVEQGQTLVAEQADRLTRHLALYGFLVPVAIAMAERTFPLFLRTRLSNLDLLRGGLLLLAAGLILRLAADSTGLHGVGGLGKLETGVALLLFVLASGIFAPRRPLPRQPVRVLSDPIQWHVISAYVWLAASALLLLVQGFADVRGEVMLAEDDAERHLLGAGFVTLLILGAGAYLLPGFARRPLRGHALLWATLVLANLAVVLRTAPLLLQAVFSASTSAALLSVAGLCGLLAVLLFGFNISWAGVAPRRFTEPTD
ncbi:MAG TPA: NnrS family protein [Chloroflexota bacterium]|nr:NnrS family protein [Chloroflexota bacterium]